MDFKIDVVKEPRGFIRVLQFVLSICGFATTTNFQSTFGFTVRCNNVTLPDVNVSKDFSYPFRLDHAQADVRACGNDYSFPYYGDYSSDSQFFVMSGVLAMLYSIGSLIFYCLSNETYKADRRIPLVDFLITTIMAVFWLSGSAAWATGLTSLKYATDPTNFIKFIDICKSNRCIAYFTGNFADLNISIIFGFLNFFLWTTNLWFLYKETSWFLGNNPAAEADSGLPPTGP